jgi:ABC-type phosphate/phosphonate transport system substrate-binding protein
MICFHVRNLISLNSRVSGRLYRLLPLLLFVSVAWGPAQAGTFKFSAPPVAGAEESRSMYAPLMVLLSRETGESFVYVHPDSWFAYQGDMQAGRFHLLLDDPHFAAWRIKARDHVPLVRTLGRTTFVVIAMKEGRIFSKEDLVGQPVCANAPPDLGTVAFLGKFDGLFRVPRILQTRDPLDRVQNLLIGQCAAAVVARHMYTSSDEIRSVAGQLKIVTETNAYPGLTLTASPDVPASVSRAIRTILLSRPGGEATRTLRDHLANGGNFVEASPADYDELHTLLRDYPGFDFSPQR